MEWVIDLLDGTFSLSHICFKIMDDKYNFNNNHPFFVIQFHIFTSLRLAYAIKYSYGDRRHVIRTCRLKVSKILLKLCRKRAFEGENVKYPLNHSRDVTRRLIVTNTTYGNKRHVIRRRRLEVRVKNALNFVEKGRPMGKNAKQRANHSGDVTGSLLVINTTCRDR